MTWDAFVLHVRAAVGAGTYSYTLTEDVIGSGESSPVTTLNVIEAPTFTLNGNGYTIKDVCFKLSDDNLSTATLSDGSEIKRYALFQLTPPPSISESLLGQIAIQNLTLSNIIDKTNIKTALTSSQEDQDKEGAHLPFLGGCTVNKQGSLANLSIIGCKINVKSASLVCNISPCAPTSVVIAYSSVYVDGQNLQASSNGGMVYGSFADNGGLFGDSTTSSVIVQSVLCFDNFYMNSSSMVSLFKNVTTFTQSGIILRNSFFGNYNNVVKMPQGASTPYNIYIAMFTINANSLSGAVLKDNYNGDDLLNGTHSLIAINDHSNTMIRSSYFEKNYLCENEDLKNETFLNEKEWPWTVTTSENWKLNSVYMAGYPYIWPITIPEDKDAHITVKALVYGTKVPKQLYYGNYKILTAYCNNQLVWDI